MESEHKLIAFAVGVVALLIAYIVLMVYNYEVRSLERTTIIKGALNESVRFVEAEPTP